MFSAFSAQPLPKIDRLASIRATKAASHTVWTARAAAAVMWITSAAAPPNGEYECQPASDAYDEQWWRQSSVSHGGIPRDEGRLGHYQLANTRLSLDRTVYQAILCQRSIATSQQMVAQNVASLDLDGGTSYSAYTNTELHYISTGSSKTYLSQKSEHIGYDMQVTMDVNPPEKQQRRGARYQRTPLPARAASSPEWILISFSLKNSQSQPHPQPHQSQPPTPRLMAIVPPSHSSAPTPAPAPPTVDMYTTPRSWSAPFPHFRIPLLN
ncbi:hypothetical protein BJV78DRAFT_1285600 [Lactifluus subvellereus]|nr:hypothetical protein BJV78DRAFT_1285600 [Lactifluus subvellereus]